MKKISILIIAAVFAVSGLAAKKKAVNPAEVECKKKAEEAFKGAKDTHKAALTECKAKKGKERAECNKSAQNSLKEANKAKADALKACKAIPAVPEIPAVPGVPATPSVPGMGGK